MLEAFLKMLGTGQKNKVQEQKDLVNKLQRYKAVFGSPDGELVLADILKNNFVFDAIEVGNPNITAFREGQRYAALSIFRAVHKDQNEILKQKDETTP